jgi:hypothetical protein
LSMGALTQPPTMSSFPVGFNSTTAHHAGQLGPSFTDGPLVENGEQVPIYDRCLFRPRRCCKAFTICRAPAKGGRR